MGLLSKVLAGGEVAGRLVRDSPRISQSKASLLPAAFAGRLSLLHAFTHLRFDRVEVEARARLHRWVFEKCLDFLPHYLLDKDEAPELELEPIEVLLASFFRSVVRPARALEGIEAQVSDVRHVRLRLITEPAFRLIDEAELVIVDPNRADRALAKIEDLVTIRRALARDHSCLIVTIEMVLVSSVAELHTLEQV